MDQQPNYLTMNTESGTSYDSMVGFTSQSDRNPVGPFVTNPQLADMDIFTGHFGQLPCLPRLEQQKLISYLDQQAKELKMRACVKRQQQHAERNFTGDEKLELGNIITPLHGRQRENQIINHITADDQRANSFNEKHGRSPRKIEEDQHYLGRLYEPVEVFKGKSEFSPINNINAKDLDNMSPLSDEEIINRFVSHFLPNEHVDRKESILPDVSEMETHSTLAPPGLPFNSPRRELQVLGRDNLYNLQEKRDTNCDALRRKTSTQLNDVNLMPLNNYNLMPPNSPRFSFRPDENLEPGANAPSNKDTANELLVNSSLLIAGCDSAKKEVSKRKQVDFACRLVARDTLSDELYPHCLPHSSRTTNNMKQLNKASFLPDNSFACKTEGVPAHTNNHNIRPCDDATLSSSFQNSQSYPNMLMLTNPAKQHITSLQQQDFDRNKDISSPVGGDSIFVNEAEPRMGFNEATQKVLCSLIRSNSQVSQSFVTGDPHSEPQTTQFSIATRDSSSQSQSTQSPVVTRDSSSTPPIRPLTAYNFFFCDERDRIVEGIKGSDDVYDDNKKRRLLLHHLTKDRKTRRKHRKTHGKIAFTNLSRAIGQRWKELPEDQKAFYRSVAEEDSDRYTREMRGYESKRASHR